MTAKCDYNLYAVDRTQAHQVYPGERSLDEGAQKSNADGVCKYRGRILSIELSTSLASYFTTLEHRTTIKICKNVFFNKFRT